MPGAKPKPMTPAKAAKVWVETKRQLDELEPELKAAAEVLKSHFRATDKQTYRGVRYACSSFRSVDQSALVHRVGADVVDACKVLRTRETLSLAKG